MERMKVEMIVSSFKTVKHINMVVDKNAAIDLGEKLSEHAETGISKAAIIHNEENANFVFVRPNAVMYASAEELPASGVPVVLETEKAEVTEEHVEEVKVETKMATGEGPVSRPMTDPNDYKRIHLVACDECLTETFVSIHKGTKYTNCLTCNSEVDVSKYLVTYIQCPVCNDNYNILAPEFIDEVKCRQKDCKADIDLNKYAKRVPRSY